MHSILDTIRYDLISRIDKYGILSITQEGGTEKLQTISGTSS